MSTIVHPQPRAPAPDLDAVIERRYELALQAVLGVVYEWVPVTGSVSRSDGLLDLLGFRPVDVPPKMAWWRARVHPDDMTALDAVRNPAMPVGRSTTAEYRVRHRDGRWIDVLDRAVVTRDAVDGLVHVIGHVIDVTQHRRHQRERVFLAGVDAALRTATSDTEALAVIDRLAEFLGVARCAFSGIDTEADRLHVRRSWGTGAAGSRSIRLSSAIPSGIAADLSRGTTTVVTDAAADDRIVGHRYARRLFGAAAIAVPWSHDGRWVSVLGVSAREPRRWDAGEVRLVEAVAARLGPALERIEAEDALRLSEARFRLAASHGSMTLFEQDAGLRYRWVYPTPSLVRDMIGRTDLELIPGPAGRRLSRIKARVLRDGAPVRQEVAISIDGATQWFDLTVNPVVAPDGSVTGVSGIALDVTRGKEAELALRTGEGQLRRALAVKDEFLGLVSHELRTPMTVILGMSRLLRNEGLPPERVREVAVDIADSAEVLNGLIDSMLLLARLDQGEADLLREPILLHRAVEQVLAQQQARDPRRRYRFQDRSGGALVDAQGMWIERIISNFLGNAAKYSRPSGTVTVTVERQGGWGSVVVRDQGPKLPAEAFEHVFEPFYRAPSARDRAPGAGLGLAVAKRLVELLQGRIWASPLPTGGAEFGFSLPLIRDEPG